MKEKKKEIQKKRKTKKERNKQTNKQKRKQRMGKYVVYSDMSVESTLQTAYYYTGIKRILMIREGGATFHWIDQQKRNEERMPFVTAKVTTG